MPTLWVPTAKCLRAGLRKLVGVPVGVQPPQHFCGLHQGLVLGGSESSRARETAIGSTRWPP